MVAALRATLSGLSETFANPKSRISSIDLVDFMDRADVRVVEGRRGFGFPLKTAESLRIVGEFVGKELQGDVAVSHGLGGRGHWVDMLGVD
jgi:hypothetical protein